MWPFNTGSDSGGCQAHHFETTRKRDNFKLKHDSGWVVEQEVRKRCGHEGCHASKGAWEKVRTVDHAVYAELINQVQNLDQDDLQEGESDD
jgi:hypothetical protein